MEKIIRKPFFYDITLRDGNQALKQPWNIKEKEIIFNALLKLGVQGAELGFSAASDVDFDAVEHLASLAPKGFAVSTLARAIEYDINKAYESIKKAHNPRIHTFIATSPFSMEYVLKKSPDEVLKKAVDMVSYAKSLLGDRGEVEFSAEHFGDCKDNIDFVLDVLEATVEAGATIVNLPNTVERYRPFAFVDMVKKVVDRVGDRAVVSVHNHNDLGMATATTVESFFAGANQLETSLNGLGERAGNTNMYEVAVALKNCSVDADINFEHIYETALLVESMSDVKIAEKTPLIGDDVLSHRSGIHQDGSIKTKNMKKGAYRPIDPEMIGRKDGELLEFTSQSGKSSVYEIIKSKGMPVSIEEASVLQPILKKIAEESGLVSIDVIINKYKDMFINIEGPFTLLEFKDKERKGTYHIYEVKVEKDGEIFTNICEGDGPIDAVVNMFKDMGNKLSLLDYSQTAFDADEKGSSAYAITTIKIKNLLNDEIIIGKGMAYDTIEANVKAVFSAMNQIDL